MNLAKLTLACFNRARADTGTGGLLASGGLLYVDGTEAGDRLQFFFGDIDNPTTFGGFPIVVGDVSASEEGQWSGFDMDSITVQLQFHIFDLRRSGLANCSTIIDRLRGNWDSTAPSTAPTYGFNRHKLDLAAAGSTWGIASFIPTGHESAHVRDHWHFIETYTAHMSK